jgi:hypothetical protein
LPQCALDEKIADDSVTIAAPSLLRYINALAGTYQTTHATSPTMLRVAERLAARGSAHRGGVLPARR